MNAGKAIVLVLGGVALFFLITEPVAAAESVQGLLGVFRDGAEAIVTFVRGLFS